MTREQSAIVRRLRRLVSDARKVGLSVVVDADAVAIRLIPTAEAAGNDVRGLGEVVDVDNACGSQGAKVSGDACCFGNT
jgi:hypothetical protein